MSRSVKTKNLYKALFQGKQNIGNEAIHCVDDMDYIFRYYQQQHDKPPIL